MYARLRVISRKSEPHFDLPGIRNFDVVAPKPSMREVFMKPSPTPDRLGPLEGVGRNNNVLSAKPKIDEFKIDKRNLLNLLHPRLIPMTLIPARWLRQDR